MSAESSKRSQTRRWQYQTAPFRGRGFFRPGSSKEAQLPFRLLRHLVGRPGWVPDDVHFDGANPRLSLKQPFDCTGNGIVQRASRRGQRHADIDVSVVIPNFVHEPEVDDVDSELGIVNLPQQLA